MPRQDDGFLHSDPKELLAGASHAHHEVPVKRGRVEGREGDSRFNRGEVVRIDECVDFWRRFTAKDSPEKGFGGGSRLRGIHPPPPEEIPICAELGHVLERLERVRNSDAFDDLRFVRLQVCPLGSNTNALEEKRDRVEPFERPHTPVEDEPRSGHGPRRLRPQANACRHTSSPKGGRERLKNDGTVPWPRCSSSSGSSARWRT